MRSGDFPTVRHGIRVLPLDTVTIRTPICDYTPYIPKFGNISRCAILTKDSLRMFWHNPDLGWGWPRQESLLDWYF